MAQSPADNENKLSITIYFLYGSSSINRLSLDNLNHNPRPVQQFAGFTACRDDLQELFKTTS